jgi:hypothetical protein
MDDFPFKMTMKKLGLDRIPAKDFSHFSPNFPVGNLHAGWW